MTRARKGGRQKGPGEREPAGRLQRNLTDGGTAELRMRKLVTTGAENMELTPLGILAGRRLITDEQHAAAARFRALHLAVFADAPKAGLPMMAKLPSDPGPWDADEAAERQARRHETWEEKRDRYNAIRDGLSAVQLETVHAIVIHEEFAGIDVRVFSDIVVLDITGESILPRSGRRAPLAVSARVEVIRKAIDLLLGVKLRAWTELSDSQRNAITATNGSI